MALPLAAQAPAFEVASIRPQPWTNEGQVAVYVRGNTLYGEHADLCTLIDFAWNLPPDSSQVTGGQGWARHGVLSNAAGWDEALFQVIAKAPSGTSPSAEEFRQMLRAYLAERFRLRVRVENREQAVFRARDGEGWGEIDCQRGGCGGVDADGGWEGVPNARGPYAACATGGGAF